MTVTENMDEKQKATFDEQLKIKTKEDIKAQADEDREHRRWLAGQFGAVRT